MATSILNILFFVFYFQLFQPALAQITDIDKLFPLADKDEIFGLSRDGKNPYQLDQEFYFNKQIFFTAKLNDKVISSYFYLNTKTGYSLLDKDFFYKVDPTSKIDAHITFPKDKEYFLYFIDAYKNEKISKITKTSIPLGPDFLENPEELLVYFKDWFGKVEGQPFFLGENNNLKSDLYVGSFDGADISLYLSRDTGTTLQNNYCVGWLGLGYVRLDGEFNHIITRVLSTWSNYQIDLLVEKDVNFIFNGKPYQSAQAKLNQFNTSLELNLEKNKEKANQKINRTDDATERELLIRLEDAKNKKMSKATQNLKSIALKEGKIEDIYNVMNTQIANPLDDIALFEAEINLKIYQTNKKLLVETKQAKQNSLNQQLQGYLKLKQKLESYRQQFQQLQIIFKEDQKKLTNENAALYQQMLTDISSSN